MIPVQASSRDSGRKNVDCGINEASRYRSHQKTDWLGSMMNGRTDVLEMGPEKWYLSIERRKTSVFQEFRDLLAQVAFFILPGYHVRSFHTCGIHFEAPLTIAWKC